MSCVARRTRSQTQKSSGSSPPASIGSAERRRRVARRNGKKSETVVLSSDEDGNDRKEKEEGEVVEGEEGQQSGFVGRSLGRKKNLGSAKKKIRRIARKNGGKNETVILSSEEDDNDKEEEVDEVEGEGERGHQSGFVRRNVGRKWNWRSGKGREEASARGSCWEGAAGLTSVRESVPSCCRRKRDGIHVSGDHDGCNEEFVGRKVISKGIQVETKSSVDGEFHLSNEFVGAKGNAPVRKTRQWGRLTKGNSVMNQEKKENNLSGRQIKVDEEASVAEFEEGSNDKDNSNHDESSNNEFEKDESEDKSHGESDDDEFEVDESKEETDYDDESIHYGSDGVNFTNDDSNHPGTSARRREIAVEEEMRISSDANMGQEDEKDGVDDHAADNDEGEEKYEGTAEEEIGREKRQVLQRENPIIQKKEIKNRMEREKPGRNSKQETSVAVECRVNGKRTKDSSRCPFSVSNKGAQDDVGDHFKKMGASNAEAQLAEDCTDDPSDATDEDVKWGLPNNCVARRTRSNLKKTPIGKFGSFSKPICIGMNNSLKPLVVDHDMHHDGSSRGHQVSDNGVPDYDGNDNVADEKGLANDFSDVSSHPINGDLDSDDDGNDCVADRKGIGTGFADNVMETADNKISGEKGTCFGDFLGDAGRVTDGSAEKGIREMGREASREQQCDYIDDDCSSCCDDSEDDDDDESDGCSDMDINEYPEGNSGNAKTKHGSLDVSLFDLLVDTISQKRVAIPNDVKSSEGENLTKELPLWFSLKPEHVKSETEENLEALWAELDFVLECEAIGSFDWQEIEVEPKGSMFSCEFKSPACQHQFVLDEQVGVICRICSFVKTEIKHYMPPMVSGTFGKHSRKGSYEEGDDSVLDEFDCEASGCSNISNDFTSGTVWDIIPELRKKMFQHQKEGFEFIWKNLAGGIVLDQLTSNSDAVGGCLISHAPGSGKTFLTIAFLQSFLQRFDDCRPMIVAPVNLLHIWEGEFIKWGIGVPLHMLNSRGFSGRESSSALELLTRRRGKLGSTGRQNLCRIIKIFSWIDRKSVLLISYGLFRKLTTERRHSDKEGQVIRKILLEYPGLLVLDEGHTARNRFSRIWQCLKRVKTQRRIMLSGTPFQNNFVELFNTLYLIRPTFAEGIFKSFGDHENGLEADPVEKEMSLQDKNETVFRRTFATFSGGIEPRGNSSRLKELRLIIDPFVHVHEGNLHKLPGLRDYFVFLYPSTLQRCILEKLTEKSNFENNYRVSCISVHPSILLGIETLDAKDRDVIKEHQADLSNARITDGVKVRFVVELVRLCAALNEKVLVFSQFVLPLSNIKHFLISSFNWTTGQEVLQLDGGIAQKCRQPIIHTFNNSQKVKVLLVSTEVCAEGMDLTGASRVVLLDLAWNPSVRRQAIGRAYRIGQKKVVYAYNLIASSTLEEKKHKIQDIKDKFSQLVFSTVAKNDTLVDTLKECDDGVLCELIKRDISASFFEKVLEPKCG